MAHHDHATRHYEREAETTRERLSHRLDELNERLTPGQLFDEVLAYTRGGGGTFMRAFSSAARQNPIPSLLIGTGCMLFLSEKMGLNRWARQGNGGAWTNEGEMAARSRLGVPGPMSSAVSRVSNAGRTVADAAASGAGAVASGAGTVAESVRSGVRGAAAFTSEQTTAAAEAIRRGTAAVGDTVSAASQQVRATAHDLRDQAAGAADHIMQGAQEVAGTVQDYSSAVAQQVSDTAQLATREAGRRAVQAADKTKSFINEQPLLCAAIGVAIGAALAAMLPSTEAEDELMGETSDSVKEALGEAASEQFETAKTAVGKVAQEAIDSAEREGLTGSAAAEAVRTLGDKVKRVVNETASTGASEMEKMSATAKADMKKVASSAASTSPPPTSPSMAGTAPKAPSATRPLPAGIPEREHPRSDPRR